ncbi:MAG: subclass B3 metallo-beta-lactamase [Erythrobacter sp.]
MFGRFMALTTALALCGCLAAAQSAPKLEGAVTAQEWAETCEPWDDWDKPAPPFKVHGNTYYVGTCGISAILILGDQNHVLIDTGTRKGSEVVLANISKLGATPKDIGLIFYSHEHFDHVAGLAFIQQASGAPILSAPEAVDTFRTGKDNPTDPQAGLHEPMAPVANVIPTTPGTSITFGGTSYTPIATPGHTPGALSWQWESCNGDDCKNIVYADSLSPISRDDYKFSDHPEYVAKYRAGLDALDKLKCDILLTPHPSHSQMVKRAATGSFVGGVTCADYAAKKHRDLDDRLTKEKADQ